MKPAPYLSMLDLKRVVDYNVRIRVKPDGSGVITEASR
jgi:hypothetical protein